MKYDPIGSADVPVTVNLAELVGAFSYALDSLVPFPATRVRAAMIEAVEFAIDRAY